MKLWLITQNKNNDYDTFDSSIVAAKTESDARLIHPSGHNWDGEDGGYTWCAAKFVQVAYIGEAKEGTNVGVILSSFNAG